MNSEKTRKCSGRSPCKEALEIVHGGRQEDYGAPEDNFKNIGIKWGVELAIANSRGWKPGDAVPARAVARMMIDLKTTRDAHHEKFDNSADIAGYAETMELCK